VVLWTSALTSLTELMFLSAQWPTRPRAGRVGRKDPPFAFATAELCQTIASDLLWKRCFRRLLAQS
jgi:hypothetical protein